MELLLTLLLLLAFPFAMVAGARWVGLGDCMRCGKHIRPWNAYCWKHSPDNPANYPGEDRQ